MDYKEALAKLHSLESFGVKPGVERITELTAVLGYPQKKLSRTIHITGTNGKGSVSAMAESILRAAGQKTGLFTSPHLHSHTERYRVDNIPIPEADFARLFGRVAEGIADMVSRGWESPTEFEAVTALALLWFAENQVDTAIIETGMGGRYDSTNIINAPISVVTNVGLDHMAYLGDTEAEIAANKADIIKSGAVAITAAEGAALDVIRQTAAERGTKLLVSGEDFSYCETELSATGGRFDLRTATGIYKDLYVALCGRHQLGNAALAVLAAELAGADEVAIRRGLADVCWPARLETISRKPLILLDGAHNYPGMCTLKDALDSFWPEKRIVCVLAMLADKEKERCLELLLPRIDKLIVTRSPYISRSADWRMPYEYAISHGITAFAEEKVADALALARAVMTEDNMLLVCGSLYMVAEARDILVEEKQ